MRQDIRVPGDVSPVERIIDVKNQEIQDIVEYNDKKKSPFRRWIQVNNDAYEQEDWLMKHSPTAYRILRFLVSNMDNYNAVLVSYKVMQEKLEYSRTTVADAVRFLKEHQYIQVVRTGGSNVYMINKHIFWRSWGTNYAYAEFDAKVIISASEQDKETQKRVQTEIKKRQEVVVKQPTFQEQIRQAQPLDKGE